jgi:hypothetical protein
MRLHYLMELINKLNSDSTVDLLAHPPSAQKKREEPQSLQMRGRRRRRGNEETLARPSHEALESTVFSSPKAFNYYGTTCRKGFCLAASHPRSLSLDGEATKLQCLQELLLIVAQVSATSRISNYLNVIP